MTRLQHLWLQAHVAQQCDGEMTVSGNGYYPGGIIAVLELLYPELEEPSRADLVAYMNENDMAHEVEYLMGEEYCVRS